MRGPLRKLFKYESAKLIGSEFRHHYTELCNKRIAELEKEYADLIQKPYQAGRLAEIISELGNMWNKRLRYEDIESGANGNGSKNIWQVQNEVSDIVQEAKEQITVSKESDDKLAVFVESLEKLRYVLNEWETEL